MPTIDATISTVRRVAATSWARNTRAPAAAASAVAASVPSSRSPTLGDAERLADEILVGQRHQHRPARRHQLVAVPQQGEPVEGVLAEVMRRVDENAFPRHTARHEALGLSGHVGDHVGHHVDVAHPVRTPARHRATRVRADDADAELGGDRAQRGIGARPRVVEQVGAFGDGGSADRTAPRVHADHHVGMASAHRGDERHDAADLLGEVDLGAGPRLHPADVDDVGAFGHRRVDPVHRGGVGERGAAVVERVGCAVDDRHHQRAVLRRRSRAEPDHAVSTHPAGSASRHPPEPGRHRRRARHPRRW